MQRVALLQDLEYGVGLLIRLQRGHGLLPVGVEAGSGVNGTVLVSLRPHNIQLLAQGADVAALTAKGFRRYAGQISQRFYFGDAIDYQVNLNQRAGLRVIAPPTEKFAVGDRVNVLIHPSHCVAVHDD